MENITTTIILIISTLCIISSLFLLINLHKNIREANKTLTYQYNLIVKMQNVLKNKSTVNETADKAEIIYQDFYI